MDLFTQLGRATNPIKVSDIEWDRDGDDINVSLMIGDEWKDEKIRRKDFEPWLEDNDYLKGSYDKYGPENDFQGTMVTYSLTYDEFMGEYINEDIVKEYLNDKTIYEV